MRLRDNEDQHSVYILYSDLLFNVVIIFLVVVLALVLRFNDGISRAAAREQAIAPPADQLATLQKELAVQQKTSVVLHDQLKQRDVELARVRVELVAAQQSADASAVKARQETAAAVAANAAQEKARLAAVGQQLSIVAGANRFTGRTGSTNICVAIDFTAARPKYVLVNASQFDLAHTTLNGESQTEQAVRGARLLIDATRIARRYDIDELIPLFRALQTRRPGAGLEEGKLLVSFSTRASLAASGWLDRGGEIDTDAALRYSRGLPDGETITSFSEMLVQQLLGLRDQHRQAVDPETVPVLHFSLDANRRITVGGKQVPPDEFRQWVAVFGAGGLILQYDAPAGNLTPDWFVRDVLTPVGYTNSVPDQKELDRLRRALTPG